MKKKLCALLACACLLTSNIAYANTLGMSASSNAALITDTNVKVVNYVDGYEVVLYTGPISQFENGSYIGTDFTGKDFVVVLEWGDELALLYYIYPISENNMNLSNTTVIKNDGREEVVLTSTLETVEPSLSITTNYYINNTEITEDFELQSINKNDTLSAGYTITNYSTLEQSVRLMICIYSQDGRMLDVATISDVIEPNSTKGIEKSLTVGSEVSSCYAKVFLWDGFNTLRPLHNTLKIGNENTNIEVVNATVNCRIGVEYNLVTTVENMPSNDDGIYSITYNPSKLELVDLCSLTFKKEVQAGSINGTNITILSVDETQGKIVFENPNTGSTSISKVLNSIRFKSLVSNEQTIITIE